MMYWLVTQTSTREVHVYPLAEQNDHFLDAKLCNCMPEVKEQTGGRMVVHKKLGETIYVKRPRLFRWVGVK